jgi:DC-STAMP-like protein
MTSLRFKNFLVTDEFIIIDARRGELGFKTILPLSKTEQKLFVQLTSFYLVKLEIQFLVDKSLFLLMSTIHVFGLLLADYSLYWFLSTIRFYGSQEKGMEQESE